MKVGGRHAEDHVAHPCVRVEDASSLRVSLRWSTSASRPPSCTARAQGLHRQSLREEGSCLHEPSSRKDWRYKPCARAVQEGGLDALLDQRGQARKEEAPSTRTHGCATWSSACRPPTFMQARPLLAQGLAV